MNVGVSVMWGDNSGDLIAWEQTKMFDFLFWNSAHKIQIAIEI